jgi:hypothetical protein
MTYEGRGGANEQSALPELQAEYDEKTGLPEILSIAYQRTCK